MATILITALTALGLVAIFAISVRQRDRRDNRSGYNCNYKITTILEIS